MSTINESDKGELFRCDNKTLDQRKTEELLEELALKKEFEL